MQKHHLTHFRSFILNLLQNAQEMKCRLEWKHAEETTDEPSFHFHCLNTFTSVLIRSLLLPSQGFFLCILFLSSIPRISQPPAWLYVNLLKEEWKVCWV